MPVAKQAWGDKDFETLQINDGPTVSCQFFTDQRYVVFPNGDALKTPSFI